jgi:carbonic anhydrase
MLTFTDDGFKASIEDETGIKPPGPRRRSPIARLTSASRSPARKDSIRGFVFDVATGKLNEVV